MRWMGSTRWAARGRAESVQWKVGLSMFLLCQSHFLRYDERSGIGVQTANELLDAFVPCLAGWLRTWDHRALGFLRHDELSFEHSSCPRSGLDAFVPCPADPSSER